MAETVERAGEVTVPKAKRPTGTAPWLANLERLILPAIVIAAVLAIWQFVPRWVGIPSYELPNLSDTLTGLQQDWTTIGTGILLTIQDALAGFLLGNFLAILGATTFAYSKNMERAFYPVAILVQTIPIMVYVPLLAILFAFIPGLDANANASAVVGVTVLITFFPTLVNMAVGFKTIDPRIYEFMVLLNASKTEIFLKLRFPSALPFLFSSLKITATLAFVGAVVGEWMTGSGINPVGQLLARAGVKSVLGFDTNPANAGGIGSLLNLFYYQIDKPGLFASVVAISILSIAFFGAMVLLERVMVPWQQQR